MSDAAKHTEIEDVLTSIRRLVSDNSSTDDQPSGVRNAPDEGHHGLPDTSDVAALDDSETDANMTLVLTPALRVPGEGADLDDEIGFSFKDQVSASSSDVNSEELSADHPGPVISENEELSGAAITDGAESDAPEMFDAKEPSFDDMTEAGFSGLIEGGITDSALDADVAAALADDEEEIATSLTQEDEPFDFKQVLEARIREFQDLEDTAAAGAVHAETKEAETAPVDAGIVETVMTDLGQTVAQEVIHTAPSEEKSSLSHAPLVEGAGELDEAMLREMVADIVRQELQGALGERITRNVRKLVRREIHRALAAHDLG